MGLVGCLCCVVPYLPACGAVGHDVCETVGGSVTVYAGFIDGVVNNFAVCGQR